MARSSHDPIWKAALAAATRNASPVERKSQPRKAGGEDLAVDDVDGRFMIYDANGNCLGEIVSDPVAGWSGPRIVNKQREFSEPEYSVLQEWLNQHKEQFASAKPSKTKDEGTKPDVSDDCEDCTMPIEFCHCKDMAGPRAGVEDDVLITEPSVPGLTGVSDMDYPNEIGEGK